MPRRNYLIILGAAIVSIVCYQTTVRSPLARALAEVADQIERRYVERVDRTALWSSAVRGMIGELGDPNSEYIDPKQAADFEEMLNQEFGGIGIHLDPRSNRLRVLSPIVGSPAYRAGIQAGDFIMKIDGQSTRDMTPADAQARIRGKPGETVRLTVERAGHDGPLELPPIPREIVNVDSVLGDTRNADDRWNFLLQKDPKIGYVRIASFGEHTADELKTALQQLQSQHAKALVLDLRNNPGGLVSAATKVCELFIPAGQPIVTTRDREQQVRDDHRAGSGEKYLDLPLAILINRNSASASEIVAACLQDNHRAVVFGQRSYGKGTVQNVIPLHSGRGILKLTTAEYWRPNKQNIHRRHNAPDTEQWGVSPDEGSEVKLSDEQAQSWRQWRWERDIVRPHGADANGDNGPNATDWSEHDPVLHRAVDYLQSHLK